MQTNEYAYIHNIASGIWGLKSGMNVKATTQMRDYIIKELLQGKVLTEQSLAARFNVSRTPVREILSVIEKQGLVERGKNAGISLRKPSVKEILEVYDLRIALEGMAARTLALHINSDTLRMLGKFADKADSSRAKGGISYDRLQKADFHFHKNMIEHCGNSHLSRVADNFCILSMSFQLIDRIQRKPVLHVLRFTHGHILNALSTSEPAKAEEAVRRHLQEAKMHIITDILGPGVVSAEIYPLKERSCIDSKQR